MGGASTLRVQDGAEVYVQSFPRPGNKVRISTNGGGRPEWSADGTGLYFIGTDPDGTRAMMIAPIQPAGAAPRRLFEMLDANVVEYAVFDRGHRFLIRVSVPDTAPQVITIGQNWTAGLGRGR